VKALTTSPEGHTYTINGLTESAYYAPFTFVVRKDWLDKVHLEVPETIDEWYQVFKAFKANDLNGNGKADEVPYSVGGHVWWLMNWGHAWDLHLFQTGGWYPDADGKMEFEFVNSKTREFYGWLNKLYKEGLLDKEFLTMGSEDKLYEKVTRNSVGAFPAFPNKIPELEKALVTNGAGDAYLVPAIPPKGPNGDQMVEVIGDMSVNGYMITANCKNPELAVKYLDYIYASKEGMELMNFGIEGWTYTKAEDGSYLLSEDVTNDKDGRTAYRV
jgi:putative aldouronate transport system substrate-binding protein